MKEISKFISKLAILLTLLDITTKLLYSLRQIRYLPGRLICNPIPRPGYGGLPVRSAIEVALDLGPRDWLRWDM